MDDKIVVLEDIKEKYIQILHQYDENIIKQECHSVEYYDINDNIFSDEHQTLMQYIEEYKKISNSHYTSYIHAKENLQDINKQLFDYGSNIMSRLRQINTESKRHAIILSEKNFIDSLISSIDKSSNLIEHCLIPIQELIEKNDKSLDYSQQETDIILQINKCQIIYNTGLFKDECVFLLNSLTKKVCGRDYYSCELLYKLGSLNLKYRLYKNAINVLEILLKKLNSRDINQLDTVHKDMYFSANMMLVTCFEYSGKYCQALCTLMCTDYKLTKNQEDYCKSIVFIFEKALHHENKDISDLVFSFEDKEKQKMIIALFRKMLLDKNVFNNKLASFVYDNASTFLQETKEKNKQQQETIQEISKQQGVWAKDIDSKNREEIIQRIITKYKIPEGKNKLLHDYLHLLAHCLNEEAVLEIKDKNYVLYRQLITLSRALMLWVSHDTDFYKAAHSYQSCFSSVYAEAGEFSVARKIIMELVNSEDYDSINVSSKAEIDFFYYLFPRIEAISNSKEIIPTVEDDEHYNHYLNCCYRSLDFDAISHMAVISCEHKIANILQQNNLESISTNFFKNKDSSIDEYYKAIAIDNYDGHNIWLTNEQKKLKYIFRFLNIYLLNKPGNVDNNSIQYHSMLVEYAYQYLILNLSLGNNTESENIPYITFSDDISPNSRICRLFKTHDKATSQYTSIEAEGACLIISRTRIPAEILNDNKAYFICDQSKNDDDQTKRYFKSEKEAAREFFLYVTFLKIKKDFINPSRIFIITPVNNAEPCKFYRSDENGLISQAFDYNQTHYSRDFALTVDQLYYTTANPVKLSTAWINRLSENTCCCEWALTFVHDADCINDEVHYTLFHKITPPLSSILYDFKTCQKNLSDLYNPKNRVRPIQDHVGHSQNKKDCAIRKVCINTTDVSELMSSFPEVPWSSYVRLFPEGKLLIWKEEKPDKCVWRIAFVDYSNIEDEEKKQREERNIMQAICNKGRDDAFDESPEETSGLTLARWPSPYDKNDKPYLFVCHRGSRDLKVKSELISFFEKNKIRFWYDRDRVADNWLDTISEKITNKNCVGAVFLIMGQDFFTSSIKKEIKLIFDEMQKRKKSKKKYMILPIIYDCRGGKEFYDLVKNSFTSNSDTTNSISDYPEADYNCAKSLFGIGNKDMLAICLNNRSGSTLEEYTQNQQKNEGRDGTVIYNCKKNNVMEEH